MMKTEDKRPMPEERLRQMFTGLPALRPAYELDAGMTMAWHELLSPAHADSEFTVLDVLPIVEEAYAMAGDSEWFHARRMAQLTTDAQHAYLDALEARRGLRRQLDALPVTTEACEALRPICEAAHTTANGNTATVWSCTGAASDIRSAYADLRMAINATKAAEPPTEIPAAVARYPLASVPVRLTRALAQFAAEASLAITTGAPEGAAGMVLGAQMLVKEACLPALARAIGHLQTPDQQAVEAAWWVSHGWGLLPECGRAVQVAIAMICHASMQYAAAANTEAAALLAELDGEWQSVEDALGRPRAAQPA
jgi:hypothetical protein